MPHHAITYHEEDKAAAGFDMEAMRMFGKQSLSLLDFVVQQQGDTGSSDVPILHRVFPRCHYVQNDFRMIFRRIKIFCELVDHVFVK